MRLARRSRFSARSSAVLLRDETCLVEAKQLFDWAVGAERGVSRFPDLHAQALYRLGRLALARGDHGLAIERLRKALAIPIEDVAKSWPHAAATSALGEALAAHGLEEAEDLMLAGHAELACLSGATHIETRYARDRIVPLYDTTGREAEAAELPLR